MRISLVTPCLNKVRYVDATIRSVLDQGNSELCYGIVDGGSTDGSLDIINKYRDRLAYVVSEPDKGMYDALNKGFASTEGEIMGYLGADDLHMPWTLSVIREIFDCFPQVDWLTSQIALTADQVGRIVKARQLTPPCSRHFFKGANLPGFHWRSDGWIQQESTFWRRSLWQKVGGLDASMRYAGDFDLWCRFFKFSTPVTVATPLAAFRRHGDQISGTQADRYCQEALRSLLRSGGRPAGVFSSALRTLSNRVGWSRNGRLCYFDFRLQEWRLRSG